MSSTRMFAHLLKTDNIYFSIRMVSQPSHIKSVFDEEHNSMEDRVILLINCGAVHSFYYFLL